MRQNIFYTGDFEPREELGSRQAVVTLRLDHLLNDAYIHPLVL